MICVGFPHPSLLLISVYVALAFISTKKTKQNSGSTINLVQGPAQLADQMVYPEKTSKVKNVIGMKNVCRGEASFPILENASSTNQLYN